MQELEKHAPSGRNEFEGEAKDGLSANAEALKYRVQLVGGRLTGTDFERMHMRREVFSLITAFGPPTFFITLNFADIHCPLAVYLAERKIDISLGEPRAFHACITGCTLTVDAPDLPAEMPSLRERCKLLAKDPVASARFFDRYVKLTLRYLLGYEGDDEPVRVGKKFGILGRVSAYYGSVEAQKKGTLHLHLLLWLLHALSPDTFFSKMENDLEYRKRVFRWIADCIKQSLPKDVDSFGLKKVSKVSVPPHTATL